MDIFDLSQVSVQDMLLISAIAKFGSVSEAAAFVRVTQPTASYRLNKIRDIFDDVVFVSVNKKMLPTSKGEALIAAFAKQIDNFSDLIEPDVFDQKTTSRIFRIIAQGFQFSTLLAKVPKDFFAISTKAKLYVDKIKSDVHVNQQLIDDVDFVAWVYDEHGAKGIRRYVSPALKVVVYYDPNTRNAPQTVKEFANCRFVMLDGVAGGVSLIDQELVRLGYAPRQIVSYSATPDSIARFVKGTDLVYVATAFTHAHGAASLAFSEIPFEAAEVRHEFRWSISKELDAGHAWFRSLLLDSITSGVKPSHCRDPSEGFVLLSEFERLDEGQRIMTKYQNYL